MNQTTHWSVLAQRSSGHLVSYWAIRQQEGVSGCNYLLDLIDGSNAVTRHRPRG